MTLYIFDLDGTLVRPNALGIKIPNTYKEQEMIPGVIERCARLRADGHVLAVASNQGGVSLGICTLGAAIERVADASEQIDAAENILCAYHEKGKLKIKHNPEAKPLDGELYGSYTGLAFWRKPSPGMLLHLMLTLEFPATDTVFVGDMDTDQQAAAAAGVRFEWARDFFPGIIPE